jgi:hypothetical protein
VASTSTERQINEKLTNQFEHCASLLAGYQPSPVTHISTAIVHCKDVLDTQAHCGVDYEWLASEDARRKALGQWDDLVGSQTFVTTVPGNHFEIFQSDKVSSDALPKSKIKMLTPS